MQKPRDSFIRRVVVDHLGGPAAASRHLGGRPVPQEIQRWVARGWASPHHVFRLEPFLPKGITVRDLADDKARAKKADRAAHKRAERAGREQGESVIAAADVQVAPEPRPIEPKTRRRNFLLGDPRGLAETPSSVPVERRKAEA